MPSQKSTPGGPSRSIRTAAYLAILFGLFGAISGLAAAGTFIPFQSQSTYDSQWAAALTGIAAFGAIVSGFGLFSGWEMLRSRPWAWNATLAAAVGCVAAVSAMTVVWPESWGFLVVVAGAYALEVIFLLIGRRSYVARVRSTTTPS